MRELDLNELHEVAGGHLTDSLSGYGAETISFGAPEAFGPYVPVVPPVPNAPPVWTFPNPQDPYTQDPIPDPYSPALPEIPGVDVGGEDTDGVWIP